MRCSDGCCRGCGRSVLLSSLARRGNNLRERTSAARHLDHHVGRLDRRHGGDAGLEAELVGGLAAHQRHHAVGAALHLDLGHDRVAHDPGDQADEAVAGRLAADRRRRRGPGAAFVAAKRASSAPSTTWRPDSSTKVASRLPSAQRRSESSLTPSSCGGLADPVRRHA